MAESKTAKVTYEGPAHDLFLKEGGQAYHPGDTFEISKDQLLDLQRRRHAFKDIVFDPDAQKPAPHEVPDEQPGNPGVTSPAPVAP